jgi:hypothetical protein
MYNVQKAKTTYTKIKHILGTLPKRDREIRQADRRYILYDTCYLFVYITKATSSRNTSCTTCMASH